MFRPHKIVIEAVGFFARQGKDLLGSRGEIVHCFFAHKVCQFATTRTVCPTWTNLSLCSSYSDGSPPVTVRVTCPLATCHVPPPKAFPNISSANARVE